MGYLYRYSVLALLALSGAAFGDAKTDLCTELVSRVQPHYGNVRHILRERKVSLEVDGVSAEERALYNSVTGMLDQATKLDQAEVDAEISRCVSTN